MVRRRGVPASRRAWPRLSRVARTASQGDAKRVGARGLDGGTPSQRADDLHAAFADPEVAVVLCAIAGNHSNELVDLLDYDLIRANPKVFQGLSDITVLHCALHRHAGLATFYGPALVTSLAEFPAVFEQTDRSMRAAWFGDGPIEYEPATEWTDEFLDFATKADLTRARERMPGDGWVWLHHGVAESPIFGGCLESLCWHVKGSAEWPDLEGCVLLLEPSEDAPSPAEVSSYLTDLRRLGAMNQISGLVFSRPINYRAKDIPTLWKVVRDATDGTRHSRSGELRLWPQRSDADCPTRCRGSPRLGRRVVRNDWRGDHRLRSAHLDADSARRKCAFGIAQL